MPPYDPNYGRDPEKDPFNIFGRRLAGLGSWLFTPSERQGIGSMPYSPDTGEGVSPMEVGQKKALGVDQTQPTFPPRTPTAPGMTRPQGGTDQTPNAPTPRDPRFRDVLGGASSTATPMEVGQKAALGDESYMRFKLPDGEWQDYEPDRSDNTGYSEQDWSKVANPMAFEAYRERPERKLLDMQAQDPFIADRMKAALQAQGQLGLYAGMRDIDRAEMGRRSQAFMQAIQQEDDEYRQAKAAITARFQGKDLADRLAQLEADHMTQQEQIKTAHGFGEKARNDAFEGIGRR